MNIFLKKLLDYDLIGIGEQAHGELTSWKFRYKIVKYLTTKYDKVYIFCESLDYWCNKLNDKNVKFIFDEYGFYPYIIHNANKSKEHLKYTKKFIKLLPKIKFYGVDIQVVKWPGFCKESDKDLMTIMNKYKDDYLENDKGSGRLRNKYNAFIMNDLLNLLRKSPKNKFVYLAHNEHCAPDCNGMRRNKNYLTDGYYLKNKLNINYLSVATYSLNMYSIWTGKMELVKDKSKKWNELFENKEDYQIIESETYPKKLNMVDYNNRDFDYVICEFFSDKMTLI